MVLDRFGRRRQAEVLGELHQGLQTLEAQMRATLVDVRAAAEERVRVALHTIDQAREAGMEQLTDALRQVAHSYEVLAERIEADRLERRALVDALARVAPAPLARPASRLIGGTVNGDREDAIDLTGTDDSDGRPAIEVRCRFGDRWVDGFEIADILDDGASVRYRVRRISDRTLLPTLFGPDDIRRTDAPPRTESTAPSTWSRR